MTQIKTGRHTARCEGEVTVFLIGMRINHLHRVDLWAPVLTAMPRMLAYLARTPEAGMLGYHQWPGRTTVQVSYWKSAEHLRRFAADPEGPHLKPWRDFRRLAGHAAVGIWHETYVVPPGGREVVYANMPEFGLGLATATVPVDAANRTAKQRLTASG